MQTDTTRWLTTREAARYLGLSPSSLHQDRRTGRLNIPFTRLGKSIIRYDRQALDDYMQQMDGKGCHAA